MACPSKPMYASMQIIQQQANQNVLASHLVENKKGRFGLIIQDNIYFASYCQHFVIPADPRPYLAVFNGTSSPWLVELEATHKDAKKCMTPLLPCKPSCKTNSSMPSQMTTLLNFGTLMMDTTKTRFAMPSSTSLLDTLSSPTPWLKKASYSLTN